MMTMMRRRVRMMMMRRRVRMMIMRRMMWRTHLLPLAASGLERSRPLRGGGLATSAASAEAMATSAASAPQAAVAACDSDTMGVLRLTDEEWCRVVDVIVTEKWRRVVHSLLWWMQARKLWAHLGQRLNQLSGLKMDDGRWLKWALRDK